MSAKGLLLLIAMAVLLAAASVVAADPVTLNTTASVIGTSDDTGDAIEDVRADDTSGASPSDVISGDGWYTADKGDVMFIDGFNTTGISGIITDVVLNVQYSVEAGYGGSNPVQWALDAGTLASTDITPANGEEDNVASYDLYVRGVDTVNEISTLDVEFTSNDNAGADAVSFDYVFVTVTYNNPPVAGTPQTYNNTTLESKTAFERNDGMFINVSVTDANGASDLDTILITISNTTGAAIVDNDTMIQDYLTEGGYVYNYSWTLPNDADLGIWTINVYVNDTSDAWDSSSTTFTVQDAQAPQWSDAQTNKTPVYENNSVKFTANWTDDVALAGYIFSINQTGTWVNSSFVSFSGTSDVSENTTQITATAGTMVEWRFYANDTSDNGNVTNIHSFIVSSPAPPPSSPYILYGRVFYKNGTACNNPVVNITNLNNSKQWQAETNASYNYYKMTLANGTHLNSSEILQFSVKAPDGSQPSTTYHTVTQAEINYGGLFDFNITLKASVTPFVIYGWVNYSNGTACNKPTVDITNTNTSTQWQAETHSTYEFYKLVLDTTKISAGDVLEFNATDGTKYNTTTYAITAGDIENGGVFDFNLTLPSAPPTEGPTVDSITITPDEDGSTPGVQIYPNPGSAKTVTVSAIVSDPNGYGDIGTVNITDIAPDPAHGDASPTTLVFQSGSGSGTTATYNGTFEMQFYDASTEYTVTVVAEDAGGLSGTDSSTFNYTSCNAMSLDAGTIAFGSINPGENNTVAGDEDMNTTGSPTVRNIGNVEIDVNIAGSDMTSGSDTITKDRMDAQVNTLGYRDLGVARCFNANMTAGASSLENVDFRLNVPYGMPAGTYNGSVTLTADTCE